MAFVNVIMHPSYRLYPPLEVVFGTRSVKVREVFGEVFPVADLSCSIKI